MARATILTAIFFGSCVVHSASSFAADSTVCVSRAEDNGVLNIRPAYLHLDGKPLLYLVGGDRKCIAVSVGRHSLVATSTDPYDPNSKDENAWRSKPIEIHVSSQHITNLIIEPLTKESTYTAPWSVREEK